MRPRLTRKEISLITKALKAYGELMEQKEGEMEHRKLKIEKLHRDLLHTGDRQILKEQEHEKEQYLMDEQQHYSSQALAVTVLLNRFKALSEGGRLHSSIMTTIFLKE